MAKNALDKTSELLAAFENPGNSVGEMLSKDIFALGCYLCSINQTLAGKKLLLELKLRLPNQKDKKLLQSFINSMEGNEKKYAAAVLPHCEIGNLLNV